ncbi:hypothetical protein C1645_842748 [Glomus cerebriforme]|uniref:Uncharacterized protein n=1 Tax=Glomus cerebriforme TaxID=658196 RepID=A0A397RWV9_9GLOM|nr:hypothetical protein C1645_842748 [Glomus cerebriforme]
MPTFSEWSTNSSNSFKGTEGCIVVVLQTDSSNRSKRTENFLIVVKFTELRLFRNHFFEI